VIIGSSQPTRGPACRRAQVPVRRADDI
jgi:hypothetical protein